MTREPIPNCPQGDEPIRERAWTEEQIEAIDICNLCHELWAMAQGNVPISDAVARMETRVKKWLDMRYRNEQEKQA